MVLSSLSIKKSVPGALISAGILCFGCLFFIFWRFQTLGQSFNKQSVSAGPLYSLSIQMSDNFLDGSAFGPVDPSRSDLLISIDNQKVTDYKFGEPLSGNTLKLTSGRHRYKFVGNIFGAGNNYAILTDLCTGQFSVSHNGVLQPKIAIISQGDMGSFATCSLNEI